MTEKPKGAEEVQDTPYNMAMLYYIRLSKIMEIKDKAAITEDISTWFNSLRSLYRNIFFMVSAEERHQMKETFTKARAILKPYRQVSAQSQKSNTLIAMDVLDEIDCKIMVIMHKRHMIFPKIPTKGLELLNERYGLNESS